MSLRCKNKALDDWLVLAKGYTPCYGTDRCGGISLTPEEQSQMESGEFTSKVKELVGG